MISAESWNCSCLFGNEQTETGRFGPDSLNFSALCHLVGWLC